MLYTVCKICLRIYERQNRNGLLSIGFSWNPYTVDFFLVHFVNGTKFRNVKTSARQKNVLFKLCYQSILLHWIFYVKFKRTKIDKLVMYQLQSNLYLIYQPSAVVGSHFQRKLLPAVALVLRILWSPMTSADAYGKIYPFWHAIHQ